VNNFIEYNNVRVLTTHRLAEGYGVDRKIISYNFNRNKDRYVEELDFFYLEGEELQEFLTSHQIEDKSRIPKMYLWTEHGAFLHAKSLSSDEAWEMYGKLVDTYFKAREIGEQMKKALPEPNNALPASFRTQQPLARLSRSLPYRTAKRNSLRLTATDIREQASNTRIRYWRWLGAG